MRLNCALNGEALAVIIYVTKKAIVSMYMSLELSRILLQYKYNPVYPQKLSFLAINI